VGSAPTPVSGPDGFGRRRLELSAGEIENYMLYQMGALYAFAKACGLPLQHVKAHGAISNMAFVDLEVSKAIARAALRFSKEIIFVALAGTVMSGRPGKSGSLRGRGVRRPRVQPGRDAPVPEDRRFGHPRPGEGRQAGADHRERRICHRPRRHPASGQSREPLCPWRHPYGHHHPSEDSR